MAKRRAPQTCPLCGQRVDAGDGLEGLGRHFERCPETEDARARRKAPHPE